MRTHLADAEASSGSEISTGSDLEDDLSWIEWYCSLKGNEHFVYVDEEFVRDDFNLIGLTAEVPYYNRALSLILEGEFSDCSAADSTTYMHIEKSAVLLYGLIHARFILTSRGMHMLAQKINSGIFGKRCVNTLCDFKIMVPCGVSDKVNEASVMLFCRRCAEVYHPPPSSGMHNIDGAFFGTAVAGLFFQTFPTLVPSFGNNKTRKNSKMLDQDEQQVGGQGVCTAGVRRSGEDLEMQFYEPKIFGFRVNPDWRNLQKH